MISVKNFGDAVKTLNSLISNAQDQKNWQNRQFSDTKLTKTKDFIVKCGMDFEKLKNTFRIVHISGTKGKGSTAAFCESILIKHGFKTGMFSSPHLKSVEERIRINGHPISRSDFTKYFWEVYNLLCLNTDDKPTFFIFLLIMAIKIFYEEKVQVAILEVGIGGKYDGTNVFDYADVVGITSLGFEHTQLLGHTIEEITWQKAGIMKPGTIAITSGSQPVGSLKVLKQSAADKKCYLYEAPPLDLYHWEEGMPKLGIDGPCQHLNASVALQITNAFLNPHLYKREEYAENNTTDDTIQKAPVFSINKRMADGLISCKWLGRTQILKGSPHITYYLDGAHTVESMQQCVHWYSECLAGCQNDDKMNTKKVLIFNITHNRSAAPFFELLGTCHFDYVYFCSLVASRIRKNASNDVNVGDDDEHLNALSKEWAEKCDCHSKVQVNTLKSISETLDAIKGLQHSMERTDFHVLITGSLHLVGNTLTLLDA